MAHRVVIMIKRFKKAKNGEKKRRKRLYENVPKKRNTNSY